MKPSSSRATKASAALNRGLRHHRRRMVSVAEALASKVGIPAIRTTCCVIAILPAREIAIDHAQRLRHGRERPPRHPQRPIADSVPPPVGDLIRSAAEPSALLAGYAAPANRHFGTLVYNPPSIRPRIWASKLARSSSLGT